MGLTSCDLNNLVACFVKTYRMSYIVVIYNYENAIIINCCIIPLPPLRLIQVVVRLSPSQGLGLAIVGGCDSANGEAPIYIKRILPDSVLQRDGKLKAGDQLIAVNDVLLVNAAKEHASEILSNVGGVVRLLAIQDL